MKYNNHSQIQLFIKKFIRIIRKCTLLEKFHFIRLRIQLITIDVVGENAEPCIFLARLFQGCELVLCE